MIVRPARNVRGSVRLPGDKSISHRYAMLAGIAEGPIAAGKLFNGRRLREHSWLHAIAGRVAGSAKAKPDNVIEVQGQRLVARCADGPARLRQFRFDHAHAERHCCGTEFHQRDDWGRVALAASHGAGDHTAVRDGSADRIGRGQAAAAHQGRGAESDRLSRCLWPARR